MGEKKLPETMTIIELASYLGKSTDFFTRNRKLFEPALVKIAGKTTKPYRFDVAILREIICAGGGHDAPAAKPSRRRARLRDLASQFPDHGDELFED